MVRSYREIVIGLNVVISLKLWIFSSFAVALQVEPRNDDLQTASVGDFEEMDLEKLLDSVVFTAAKHEQDINESPSAITVISQEQIENTYCTDLVCLLRQVPEVDVLELKPMYAAVGARALTDEMGDKVLVTIDGREINIETVGFPAWLALPVHLQDIERIEIIRGPGSALYGANAHSLVVSIVTKKASENAIELYLGGGEVERNSLQLRLGQKIDNWSLVLSGGRDTGGHWQAVPNPLERQVNRVLVKVDYDTDASSSSGQLGFINAQGSIYSVFGPSQIRDVYDGFMLFSHQREFLRVQTYFEAFAGEIPVGGYLGYNGAPIVKLPDSVPFVTTTLDAEVQFNWRPFTDNLLITGGSYRWITLFSDEMDPGEIHQHRVGLFVHDEQRLWKRLLLTAGVRFDYNNLTPFTVSPRIACVWQFVDDQFLRVSFGQAFRKPSFFNSSLHLKNIKADVGAEGFKEFFRHNLGNEELDNESISVLEAGYRGTFLDSKLMVEADGFYNRYRNTINLQVRVVPGSMNLPDLEKSVARFFNTGREVDSLGGVVSLTYWLRKFLRFNINYTYRFSFYTSDTNETEGSGEGGEGDRVPWERAHMLNLNFHYISPWGLRVGMGIHAASSCDWVLLSGGIFGEKIPAHQSASWYLSGFAGYRFGFGMRWFELGIRANNALNMGFRDMAGVVLPDGNVVGGELMTRQLFFYLQGEL